MSTPAALVAPRQKWGRCTYCLRRPLRLLRVDKTQMTYMGQEYGWSVWICRRCFDRCEEGHAFWLAALGHDT